jgi:hypothetical protein
MKCSRTKKKESAEKIFSCGIKKDDVGAFSAGVCVLTLPDSSMFRGFSREQEGRKKAEEETEIFAPAIANI